jgi:hypothetical protein
MTTTAIAPAGDHIEDEHGTMLRDDQTAREYAMQIIHELRKGDAHPVALARGLYSHFLKLGVVISS